MTDSADGDLRPFLLTLLKGKKLTYDETKKAFDLLMAGGMGMAQIGGLLTALRLVGEDAATVAGAAEAMRNCMHAIDAPENAMDIVGTGGDKSGSYNISTATAFVVAGCGVPVAKHGNRAATSKSGAADVLAALGFNLDGDRQKIETSIKESGFGFMLAQNHHQAVRHVMPARLELGFPTIFNFLGPLCNPAKVKYCLIGCFDESYIEIMAHSLLQLGVKKAFVMTGYDGIGDDAKAIDEFSLSGVTKLAILQEGKVTNHQFTPEDAGRITIQNPQIQGGSADENALALMDLLKGVPSHYREIVILNAAAALMVSGQVKTLKEGAAQAEQAIDQGHALKAMVKARQLSQS